MIGERKIDDTHVDSRARPRRACADRGGFGDTGEGEHRYDERNEKSHDDSLSRAGYAKSGPLAACQGLSRCAELGRESSAVAGRCAKSSTNCKDRDIVLSTDVPAAWHVQAKSGRIGAPKRCEQRNDGACR